MPTPAPRRRALLVAAALALSGAGAACSAPPAGAGCPGPERGSRDPPGSLEHLGQQDLGVGDVMGLMPGAEGFGPCARSP